MQQTESREELIKRIRKYPRSLDSNARKDRELVLIAVKENGLALEFVDETFKQDREVVFEAVKQIGSAIEFANESFKKDREFILQVVSNNESVLVFADKSLKRDREIVMQAVRRNRFAIGYADESLQKDRGFLLESGLKSKKDREYVLESVKLDGLLLEYADESLKRDKEIVVQAVLQNGKSIEFANSSLFVELPFHYSLSQVNEDLARNINSKWFELFEISRGDSILTKLSRDFIGMYSNNFGDESYLYYCLQLQETNPKYVNSIFNFQRIYSIPFMEKLIILQILKNLCSLHPTMEEASSKTIDYHLFCFKLDKLLEENQSILTKQTNYSKIRQVILDVSSKFASFHYSKREMGAVICFFNEWTRNSQTFEDYKQLLTNYKQLGGDFSKIIRVITQFNNYSNKEYDLISVLGHGGEGVALKAFGKKRNEMLAIKIKFEKEFNEESTQERISFIRRNDIEGKIMCYECNLIDNYMYSIMELGDETLGDYIDRNNNIFDNQGYLSKENLIEMLIIFTKVLKAVKSIHDHNISHRDLDPKNVVKINELYKIIDFDIAKVVKTGDSITLTVGKFAYMSPEVSHDNYEEILLNGEKLAQNIGNITTSCDIFSLGCMLLKLLTQCSLRLGREFLEDSNFKIYGANYQYFKDSGSYFYMVLTDLMREKKLHHAIKAEIDQHVDPAVGVNRILVKCLITMIQKDSTKRLDCFTHLTILSKVISFLKGEEGTTMEQILQEMKSYKEITELKDVTSY